MRFPCLPVVLLLASQTFAQEPDAKLIQTLTAKDFWEKTGAKKGQPWTEAEIKTLRDLQATHPSPTLRLRANKIVVDSENNGRYSDPQLEIVVKSFQHLEDKINETGVHFLCAEAGFSHYTVSARDPAAREQLFLIENVGPGGIGGGLNLRWDAQKRGVSSMAAWGSVPAKK